MPLLPPPFALAGTVMMIGAMGGGGAAGKALEYATVAAILLFSAALSDAVTATTSSAGPVGLTIFGAAASV